MRMKYIIQHTYVVMTSKFAFGNNNAENLACIYDSCIWRVNGATRYYCMHCSKHTAIDLV